MLLLPHSLLRYISCSVLLAGLSLALFSGCGDPAPVTAEKSKFQVAGEDDEQPAEKNSGTKSKSEFPGLETEPLAPKLASADGKEPTSEEVSKTAAERKEETSDDDFGASPQYPLPPGKDPQDVADFLQNLQKKKPKGRTKQEQEADYLAIQDSRLAAARKLLTYRLQDEIKFDILQMMLGIHQGFIDDKVQGAEERLEAFAKELSSHKDPNIAEFGRMQEFDIAVNKLAHQTPPPADGKDVVAAIEKYVIAAKGSPAAFMAAARKCVELQEIKGATPAFQKDLIEEIKKIAERYKDSPIRQIAVQAKEILETSGIFAAQVDIKPLLQDFTDGKEGAEEKYLAANQELLKKEQPSESLYKIMRGNISDLEFGYGKFAAVLKLHEMLEVAYKDHSDKELAELVAKGAASARTRIGLLGKPLVVEGVTPDGKEFDFAPYKGKYVLVDFWATWCKPCLDELPNVKKNYAAYHAKGFEVIGISLDADLEELERFLSLQGPPWKTVISQELFEKKTVEDYMANPVAVANGVQGIPFVVLLGKDGNVDSIHLRGPKLEARLKELLGEPAKQPAAEDAKEQPAEEKPVEEKPVEEKPVEKKPAEESAEKPGEEKAAEKPAVEPKKEEEGGGCGAAGEEEKQEAADEESKINPYSAKPGLSNDKLVAYIEKMLDKPKSIQGRPGFTEAVVEACDRVLTANPTAKETETLTAAEAKFETLHKKACAGDEACDKALVAFTDQLKEDSRPRIARQVAFFQKERKVLDGVELPADKIPDLLKELKDFYATEKLTSKHLRMASSTVALINKLESGDVREKEFTEFGGLFAKASDKELARYGKKLAQKPEVVESDLVGKDLDLAGTTAAGNAFKWADYRGKVVLVDFWATWCPPCREQMPLVKELYQRLQAQGFAVVGVSVDKDQEALATFLAENQIPWENLAGDETEELADKHGVRGYPTMMAVGKDGKVLGVGHDVRSLTPIIEKALAAK